MDEKENEETSTMSDDRRWEYQEAVRAVRERGLSQRGAGTRYKLARTNLRRMLHAFEGGPPRRWLCLIG